MLKFFKWFFSLFSPYVNSFERKVDKFFRSVKSTDGLSKIKRKLLSLMQEDLVITNVWLEKKFKGYLYLSKSVRRQMYLDKLAIVASFESFCESNPVDLSMVKADLSAKGLTFPSGDEKKLEHLAKVMAFLQPGKYYNYIKTASFGKLLRDPRKNKLEGDCNQIVTLYIYLFSLKFPLELLNIKLLPEHVCLHYRGIDIEATNATFQKYIDSKDVLPVSEIISTNLLDLSDFREEVQHISPRVMVKSAQLAYAISSLKPLVSKNLNIAYRNLGVSAMNSNDFKTAVFFLSKAGDSDVLATAYHNAAIYYLKVNNFKKAKYFARQSSDRKLEKSISYNEGVYYYKRNNTAKALGIFTTLGDEGMKKACYSKDYNKLQKKVSNVKTLADVKKYKSTYKKMLALAQKMGDSTLTSSLRDTLSKV
jgi:hypothetical protein